MLRGEGRQFGVNDANGDAGKICLRKNWTHHKLVAKSATLLLCTLTTDPLAAN